MSDSATVELRVQLLRPSARLPSYMTAEAAGLDLAACIDAPIVLLPGKRARVPTGIAIALPAGHEAQVRPRSGLAWKHGITLLNSPGTVDADYRGEVMVLLVHLGDAPFTIQDGDRIAQLVIARVERAALSVVASLDETARGSGGYGHTGV